MGVLAKAGLLALGWLASSQAGCEGGVLSAGALGVGLGPAEPPATALSTATALSICDESESPGARHGASTPAVGVVVGGGDSDSDCAGCGGAGGSGGDAGGGASCRAGGSGAPDASFAAAAGRVLPPSNC